MSFGIQASLFQHGCLTCYGWSAHRQEESLHRVLVVPQALNSSEFLDDDECTFRNRPSSFTEVVIDNVTQAGEANQHGLVWSILGS